MNRDRIDWNNLPQLLRKTQVGATREDLAARKFNMGKANHKGRCHLSNQKRRQIKLQNAQNGWQKHQKMNKEFLEFKARVRAYWLGQTEEHP
jgi:hypothetical protein